MAKTRSSSGLSPPQGILGPRTLLLLRPFLNSFSTGALMEKMSGDKRSNGELGMKRLEIFMKKEGSDKMLTMTGNKKEEPRLRLKRQQ